MALKPQVGDVVHVRGTVTSVQNFALALPIGVKFGGGDAIWLIREAIIHIERAPLKVGDRVLWRGDGAGTIAAIDGVFAWLKGWPNDAGGYATANLDELERADEPRPLKVGDKVRHIRGGDTGTVVALGGISQPVTVKWDHWERYTPQQLADLERVE